MAKLNAEKSGDIQCEGARWSGFGVKTRFSDLGSAFIVAVWSRTWSAIWEMLVSSASSAEAFQARILETDTTPKVLLEAPDHMVSQEEKSISRGKSAPDRFTLGPLWLPVAFALVTGTVLSFKEIFGLLLILTGAVAAVVWLPVMLVYIYQALKRGQWRRAVSFAAILICSWPIMGIEVYCGDYVHFALAYPFYELKLANTPDRYSKQTSFRWSGTGFVSTVTTDRTVVYDATGTTAPLAGTRRKIPGEPNAWQAVRHLGGNFYLVENGYAG